MKIIKVKNYDVDYNKLNPPVSATHFKHDTIRPIQYKILSLVEKYYSHYDNIFIEAQTGVGKSAISDAVAEWRKNEYSERTAIIVNRKQLLAQYRDKYGHFVFMGKNEYPCYAIPDEIDPYDMGKHVSADMGACKFTSLDFKCPFDPRRNKNLYNDPKYACPYYYNRNIASKLNVITASSLAMLYNVNVLGGRDLLIWDEADSAFDDLIKFYTRNIREEFYFKKYKIRFNKSQIDNIGYWDTIIPQLIASLEQDISAVIDTIKYTMNKKKQLKYHYRLHILSEKLNTLNMIKSDLKHNRANIVIRSNLSELKNKDDFVEVEFLPLSLANIMTNKKNKYNIFNDISSKRIFIGATLYPELMVRQLNLEPERSIAIKIMKHPFPVENRRVIALSVGKMSKNHKIDTLPKLLSAIDTILEIHENEPGIILPNSRWLHDEIVIHLIDNKKVKPRVIVHEASQKSINWAIDKWNKTDNGVLVSTYLKQGFDGSHGEFVVIPKVPFPSLGDTWVRRRKNELEYGDIEYKWKAIKDIIQMQGRCTRSATDKSIIYILDSDFNWMFYKNKGMFYDWFVEALQFVPMNVLSEVAKSIRSSTKIVENEDDNYEKPKRKSEELIAFE